MADKRIQDLTQATSVQLNDLFVFEQSGAAKSLSWQTLITDLAAALAGHGGISNISYAPPDTQSLNGTLTITMADASTASFTVTNGNGIASISIGYGISNSGTNPTYVSSWGNSPIAPTDANPYGWTRIAITDTTGITTYAYSVTVKADDPSVSIGTVSADSGASPGVTVTNSGTAHDAVLNFDFTLPKGDTGDTGDYIEPVVSYGTSTAAATEPVTWYNSPTSISYVAGNYIWKKTEYTLHDGQTVQSTVKEIIGYIGQNGSGSGTVNQITFNGTVYQDDGTGNVSMSIDADDVGAIENPSTKSNGQVLTYDSSAGKWVAANPASGNVNTVNSKGVDTGTNNITLYASDIKMSSSDNTTIDNAIPSPSSTIPSNLGTAAAGSGTTWARADHVHNMPSASDVGAFPGITYITSGSADLNNYTTAGIYCFVYGVTLSNVPNNAVDGFLIVLPDGVDSVKQLWHRTGGTTNTFKDEYVRLYQSGVWGNWAQISGYNTPSITLNTVSGYTFSNFACRKKNGWVFVGIQVETTASPSNASVTVCTLPDGYRPDSDVHGRSPGQSGGHYYNFDVNTSGSFTVSRNPTQVAAKTRICFSFPVAY